MKAKFTKAPPKYVHYRDYKNFNEHNFKIEQRGNLVVDVVDENYETFHNIYFTLFFIRN